MKARVWLSYLKMPGNHNILSIVRAGLWGVIDQSLISCSNFISMLFIARSLTANEFGKFVIFYAILLFANALQSALVLQPVNIAAPSYLGPRLGMFASTVLSAQLIVAVALSAITFLFASALNAVANYGTRSDSVLLAVACFFWQSHEFVRYYCFATDRANRVLIIDGLGYGLQTSAIALLYQFGDVTQRSVFLILGATSIIASLCGTIIAKELRFRWGVSWPLVGELWAIGRWLFATSVVRWLASQAYPLLASLVIGAAATGVIRASQLLIAPLLVLSNGLQLAITPIASRKAVQESPARFARFMWRVLLVTLLPIVLYGSLLVQFRREVFAIAYSTAYNDYLDTAMYWAVIALLFHIGRIFTVTLSILRGTRMIFISQMLSAIVTFTIGLALMRHLGVTGALLGAVVTNLTYIGCLFAFYRRSMRDQNSYFLSSSRFPKPTPSWKV